MMSESTSSPIRTMWDDCKKEVTTIYLLTAALALTAAAEAYFSPTNPWINAGVLAEAFIAASLATHNFFGLKQKLGKALSSKQHVPG